LGGNRKDYNDDPRVIETPEFYCLDPDFWRPDLAIPEQFVVKAPPGTIKLYHSVGNFDLRTGKDQVNIKSTHIYVPLVERLKAQGHKVEFLFFTTVPNRELRFYQLQADIFLDMLTYGWFGANAREAMMLGKPVICYLNPDWLESVRQQVPDYVDELPIINATPDTVEEILIDLINNPAKREEIGRRGRRFAEKWHSSRAAALRFSKIYQSILSGADGR
jgi:glycosyltransferase involved in cell wall biosynthesis